MLTHYLKIAWRNLRRNHIFTIINLLGLSLGVACCVITYAFLSLQWGMEEQHTKGDRVFMIKSLVDRDGEPEWYGTTPTPMGPSLKADFPQVTHASRVEDAEVIVQLDNMRFYERVRLVDPDFFEMMDFPLRRGSFEGLHDRNSVIISEEMSEKYFAGADPIGQSLQFHFGQLTLPLQVNGVIEHDIMHTSFGADFFGNIELLTLTDEDFAFDDWSYYLNATLIMLNDPAQLGQLGEYQEQYIEAANASTPNWVTSDFGYTSIATIFSESQGIRWDISRQEDVVAQLSFIVVALLILLLACINYINIAITNAVKRLKEIGTRKVLGGNRRAIIAQFLIENLVLTSISLALGLWIGLYLFLPGVNDLFGVTLTVEVVTIDFLIFTIGLLMLTALLAGAYPALYISKFDVISIFKNKSKFGRRNAFFKTFLTAEFIFACISVSGGIYFIANAAFQQNKSWGYDQSSLLVMEFDQPSQLMQMKDRLDQLPAAKRIAAASNHVGLSLRSSIVDINGERMETRCLDVDENYLRTIGLSLISGADLQQQDMNSVIVNETFVRNAGWTAPLGMQFDFDSSRYTVKGVAEDFHYYSFFSEIQPAFIRIDHQNEPRYLIIATDNKELLALNGQVEGLWDELFPMLPYSGQLQTDLYDAYWRNEIGKKVLMIWISSFALLITCLGLYGLIGLNISARIKELCIRKVVGANRESLFRAISAQFLPFLIAAAFVGIPLSYWMIKALFDAIYPYHIEVTVLPVIGGFLIICATLLLTVLSQFDQIVRLNPSNGLRTE
ncbi:MAG: ABC transporter permease [Bacteroidota bacterium]